MDSKSNKNRQANADLEFITTSRELLAAFINLSPFVPGSALPAARSINRPFVSPANEPIVLIAALDTQI